MLGVVSVMGTAGQWLAVLGRLNVYRSRGGPAPHKPLLLLVLLELAERGELPPRVLPLTPELAFRFSAYWSVVAHRRTRPPDVRLPFYHLQTDGCWEPLREDGSPADGPRTSRYAKLDPGFEAALHDQGFRREARRVLIDGDFEPGERLALRALVGLPTEPAEADRVEPDAGKQEEAKRAQGRSARFRLDVVAAYGYACALTGHRLTTITGASLVDAAHIRQFARSGCDEVGNGMALSKNAHWASDAGLWGVTDDYRVLVAIQGFAEECPGGTPLAGYHGRPIWLPGDRGLWPSPLHLAWHRRHKLLNG